MKPTKDVVPGGREPIHEQRHHGANSISYSGDGRSEHLPPNGYGARGGLREPQNCGEDAFDHSRGGDPRPQQRAGQRDQHQHKPQARVSKHLTQTPLDGAPDDPSASPPKIRHRIGVNDAGVVGSHPCQHHQGRACGAASQVRAVSCAQ